MKRKKLTKEQEREFDRFIKEQEELVKRYQEHKNLMGGLTVNE